MAELLEKVAATTTTNVAVTTTTETVAISSGPVKVPYATCRVAIKAWCQLTTGTATTTVATRIRRGTAITGTLVGEANVEDVKVAAGLREPFFIMTSEDRANVDSVEYSLTVEQASASADGTIVQASIEVEILNG